MPLNQTIFSPLTNYSGSISAFTSDNSTVLQLISSSITSYQNTGWKYQIMTNPITTTTTTQVDIADLTLTLENNKKYIVEGYLSAATIRSANGVRIGISSSLGVETHYAIEVPTSTTAIGYSYNTTNLAGSGPGNSLTDYYLVYIKGLIITKATGATTWNPTYSSEGAGGGATDVAIGPSVIYYREY
jgi:hypothetical protein